MKTWTYALIGALAALVIVAGVGGYMLGNRNGRASAVDVRNRFFAERTGGLGGDARPAFAGDLRLVDAGTMGTVKSVEGNTIIVTTRNGDVRVQLGDSTVVRKMAEASLQDVQSGETVAVTGEADSTGNVTATSIQVMPAAPDLAH